MMVKTILAVLSINCLFTSTSICQTNVRAWNANGVASERLSKDADPIVELDIDLPTIATLEIIISATKGMEVSKVDARGIGFADLQKVLYIIMARTSTDLHTRKFIQP